MADYVSSVTLVANVDKAVSALENVDKLIDNLESGKHQVNIDANSKNFTEENRLLGDITEQIEALKKADLSSVFGEVDASNIENAIGKWEDEISKLENKKIIIDGEVNFSGLSSVDAVLPQSLLNLSNELSSALSKAYGGNIFNGKAGVDQASVSLGSGISAMASELGEGAEELDEEAAKLQAAAIDAAAKVNQAWQELKIERVNTSQQSDYKNLMTGYQDFFNDFGKNLDADKVKQYSDAMKKYQDAIDSYKGIYADLQSVSEKYGGSITYEGLSDLGLSDEAISGLMKTLQAYQETARNAKDIIKTLSSDEGIKGLTTLESSLDNNAFGNGMTQMQNMLSSVADLDTSGLVKANEDFEKLIETYQKLQDNFQSNGGKINLDELVNGEGLSTDEVVKFGDTYKKTMDEVKASTKQASTEFKEINNFEKQYASFSTQIENVGNGAARGNLEGLNTELSQTIKSMREAAQAGNLDAFNQSAQEATRITNELNSSLKEASSGSAFFNNLGTSISSAFSGLTKIIGTWQISRLVRTMASDVVSSVNEIDTALNQLQIVTGATSSEMNNFFETAVQQAKDLGQSVTDVLDSIQVYSRLGYDLGEASELAEYTSILSNVANVETSEATQGLTSVIKGFDLSVEDAEHVADVLIEVGQNYAVSASEILEAFTQSSAAFGATGTSFEEAAAIIAAGNAAVQDASTVGTALKTVSARIRRSTTELDELGESYDDLADGFSKYRDELLSLTGFDIMVEGSTNDFKDIYEIFGGISEAWDTLSETQQSRVSEILGGTRQLQVISSILNNWDDAVGAYTDAMDSAGVATEAQATHMESIQAKLDQFSASVQELYYDFLNSQLVADVVDIGTQVIQVIDNIVEAIGTLSSAILALGAVSAIKSIDQALKNMTTAGNFMMAFNQTSMGSFVRDLTSVFTALTGMSNVTMGVTASASNLLTGSIGSNALAALENLFSNHALGSIGLITAAVAGVATAINNYNEAQRQAAEDAAVEWGSSNDSINDYKTRVDELKTSLDNGTLSEEEALEAKKELLSIQDALSESYGAQASGLDLVNGELIKQLDLMDGIAKQDAKIFLNDYGSQVNKATKQIEGFNQYLGQFSSTELEYFESAIDGYEKYFSFDFLENYGMYEVRFEGNAEDVEGVLNDVRGNILDIQEEADNNDLLQNIYDGADAAIEQADKILEKYQEIYDQAMEALVISDKNTYELSTSNAGKSGQTAAKWLADYAQAVSDYNEALAEGDQETITKTRENLQELTDDMQDLLDNTDFSKFQHNVDEIASGINVAGTNLEQFKEAAEGINLEEEVDVNFNDNIDEAEEGLKQRINDMAERIKSMGITDIELEAQIVQYAGYTNQPNIYNSLMQVADLLGLSMDDVVNAFADAGVVTKTVTDEIEEASSSLASMLASNEDNGLSAVIDQFQSDIDDIQSALDQLRNGEEVNLADLIQDFPDLTDYMDDLEGGLEQIQFDTIQSFSDSLSEILDTTEGWTKSEYQAFDDLYSSLMSNVDFSAYADQYKKSLKSFTTMMSESTAYQDLGLIDQLESAIGKNEYAMEAVVMLSMNPDAANWTYQEFCQQLENAVLYIQLRVTEDSLTELQDTLDGLQEEQDLIESSQSLSEAMNIKKTTKDYKQLIDNSKKQVSNLKDQNNLLKVQESLYKSLGRDTKDIESQINDNTKAINSALEDQISWNNEALALNYNQAAEGIDAIRKALSEAASDTLLSSDSISDLINTLSDLEDFDATKVFYQTADGVDVNTEALKNLENEYVALKKQDYQSQLADLGKEFSSAKGYLDNYCDGWEKLSDSERDAILAAAGYRGLDEIQSDIMYVDLLSSELDGLTSAYQTWVNAQSQGSYADAFQSMGDYYSTAEDLINRGWVGNEGLNAYLDLMLSAEQRTGNAQADFQKLTETIEGTDHSLMDYFQYDENGKFVNGGLYDFIDDVIATMGEGYARLDEETGNYEFGAWTQSDVQALADRFGTSTDYIYKMIDAMKEAGFEITTTEDYIQDALDAAKGSTQDLKDLQSEGVISQKLDLEYDVSELSADEIQEKISDLENEKVQLGFKLDTGEIDYDTYQEAISEIDAMIETLEDQDVRINIETEVEEGNLQELNDLIAEGNLEEFALRVGIDVENEEELTAAAEVVQQLAQQERVEVAVETAIEETGMSLEELAQYDDTEITEYVNVDAADAEATVDYIQSAFEEEKTWDLTVRIDEDQFDQLTQNQDATVDVNADTSEAMGTVDEFIAEVEGKEATIQIKTSSSGTESTETSSSGADIDAKVNYTVGEYPTEIEEPATGIANYELGEYPTELPEPVSGTLNLTVGEHATSSEESITGTVEYKVDDSEVQSYEAPSKEGILTYTVQVEGDTGDMGGQATGSTITFSVDSSQVDSYVPEGKEAVVTFSAETSAPDGYQPADKNATVIYSINVSQPNGYQPGNKTATVNYIPNTSALPTSFPTITRTVNYVASGDTGGAGSALGTAHASGTAYGMWSNYRHSVGAYANGTRQNWALPQDEVALTNETGEESIVRNGQWMLLPGGAHFENLKRGDIVNKRAFIWRQVNEFYLIAGKP